MALKELELIYHESLPRSLKDGKWRTDHTVFCNMYKREGNTLLISGESYYKQEVKNKKKKIYGLKDSNKEKEVSLW